MKGKILIFLFFSCLNTHGINTFAKTFVHIHGGPGFNSEPERNILKPYLESQGHRVYLWNEPSVLRSEGARFESANAYDNLLKSSNEFLADVCRKELNYEVQCQVTIIAHSFGVHAATYLAQRNEKVIKRLILISPTLNIEKAESNILKIAHGGLIQQENYDAALKLEALLPQVKENFDSIKIQAFTIASGYQLLFLNYWVDHQLMGQYFAYLTGNYQFDAQGFFAVRMSMPLVAKKLKSKIKVPTQVYFGTADPVVDIKSEQEYLKRYFKNLKIEILDGSKHYSHIENTGVINW